LDTGKLVAGPFKSDYTGVGAIRFSQDSKKLAVKSDAGTWLEVWDIETQKFDVRVGKYALDGLVTHAQSPVFWTTKDKTIVAVLDFNDGPSAIHEFDALTLKTVGASFQGHTGDIKSLALSFDCALLASTSYDNTIKLWAFESRQLLVSFDIQNPRLLLFSPNSPLELAYSTGTEIHICDIPPRIIAGIWPNTGAAKNPRLVDLLNSDATSRAVRRKPVISPAVTSFAPRPQRPSPVIHSQRPAFLRLLRKLIPFSSPTNPVRNDQPRDPLDFPATSPLPHSYSHLAQETAKTHLRINPHEISRSQPVPVPSPITQSRLHHLSSWWPIRTGHASLPTVDVSLAPGKLRIATAGAPTHDDDDLIRDEDYVSPRPSPNPS
jgi:WD40 repeat protein